MISQRRHNCCITASIILLLCLLGQLTSASDQQLAAPGSLNADASAGVQPPHAISDAAATAATAAAAQQQTGGPAPNEPQQQEQPRRQDWASQGEQLVGSSHSVSAASGGDSVGQAPLIGNALLPGQPVCPLPGLQDLFAAAAGAQSRLSSNTSDADAAQQQDSDIDGVCAGPNATAVEAAAAAQLSEQAAAAAAAKEAAAAAAGPAEAVEEDEDVHDRHNFASAKDGAKVLAANKEAKVSFILTTLRVHAMQLLIMALD